jgi:HEAT repeat protein
MLNRFFGWMSFSGLVFAALLQGACVSRSGSTSPVDSGDGEPPRIRVAREEGTVRSNFGRETDPYHLFVQLDRQLRNFRDPTINSLARRNMQDVMRRYVEANFDMISQATRGDNERHRLVAAWALGFSRNPRAIPRLLELLEVRSAKVRANALSSLSNLADPATPVTPIVAQFSDPDAGVRTNAALAVRSIITPGHGTEVVVPLTGLLKDEDPLVRLAAVGALGEIARPECFGFLVGALEDKKPLVRSQAALALGKLRDPAGVSHLMNALQYEQIPVAVDSIVKALEAITGQSFPNRQAWFAWWKEWKEPEG